MPHGAIQQRIFSPGDDRSLGLPGWDWSTVQTSPGILSGVGRDLYLPHLDLHEERFEGVTTNHFGVPPAGSIAVSLSLNPQQVALVNGRVWREGVCVWTRDTEVNALVPPMCLYTVIIRKQAFLEYVWEMERLDVTPQLKDCPRICNDRIITERLARQLAATITRCFRQVSLLSVEWAVDEVQSEVLDDVMPVVANTLLAARRPQTFRAQARTVREAQQFVLSNLQGSVRIDELCKALGMSRRQLQSSFNDVVGMGPLSYIRALRLGKAQESLVGGGSCGVRDIASRCGFRHLGRFGKAYREMFGESPSSTLRRSTQSLS